MNEKSHTLISCVSIFSSIMQSLLDYLGSRNGCIIRYQHNVLPETEKEKW